MRREPFAWIEVGVPESLNVWIEKQAAQRAKTLSGFVRDTLIEVQLRTEQAEQRKVST